MGTRRKGREAALQILYQVDLSAPSMAQAVMHYWEAFALEDEGRDFADQLVHGVDARRAELDAMLTRHSHHWRLQRMNPIDRNVLRLAVYELLTLTEVPTPVVINEAIELAKRYGSDQSAAFVNGILDRIAAELRS